MKNLFDRITIDNEICNGKPSIRGMRISVSTIIQFLLYGTSESEILHQYHDLTKEDIEACRLFTTKMMEPKFSFREVTAHRE